MLCLKYHKMIKCLIKPLIVRYASKFNLNKNISLEQTLVRQTLDQNHQLTTNDWRELRDKLMALKKQTNAALNIDTIILGNCLPTQLDLGKSYMKFLAGSSEEPNTSTLINLLKLYYKASKAGSEITNDDRRVIIEMYEKFLQKYPVFDSTLGEAVIYGLLLTSDWRKSLEILDSIKILSTPSSAIYSAIVQRAIQEGDEHLMWQLMNNMITECKVLHSDVFVAYIAFCEKNSNTFTENINRMLTCIEDNQIVISTEVANVWQQ